MSHNANTNASSFPSLNKKNSISNSNLTFKQPQASQCLEVNNKVETSDFVESFESGEIIADSQTVPAATAEPQETETEPETETEQTELEKPQAESAEHFIDFTLTDPELPAESSCCLAAQPIDALTFSNNEIINESFNLNETTSIPKEAKSQVDEQLSQIGSAIETLDRVITQEEGKAAETATQNQAQEIVIETSEF
jgi:hypothetical protein